MPPPRARSRLSHVLSPVEVGLLDRLHHRLLAVEGLLRKGRCGADGMWMPRTQQGSTKRSPHRLDCVAKRRDGDGDFVVCTEIKHRINAGGPVEIATAFRGHSRATRGACAQHVAQRACGARNRQHITHDICTHPHIHVRAGRAHTTTRTHNAMGIWTHCTHTRCARTRSHTWRRCESNARASVRAAVPTALSFAAASSSCRSSLASRALACE